MSAVRLVFPRPGFFLNDVRALLTLDGALVYDGGFLAGIDVVVEATPGPHKLESVLDLGLFKRRRAWDVEVPATGCDVGIVYSRFWGNFSKKVTITLRG